jgi:hypothetical protein
MEFWDDLYEQYNGDFMWESNSDLELNDNLELRKISISLNS